MATTVKPTGIEISRSGLTMAASWKVGQAYSKQEYKYTFDGKYPKAAGTDTMNGYVALNNGVTHDMTVTIPTASLFPGTKTKCSTFTVQVRGYATSTGKWSAWTSASYKFIVPNNAEVSKEKVFIEPEDPSDDPVEKVNFIPTVLTDYVVGKGDPDLRNIKWESVISSVVKQGSVKWSEGGKGNEPGSFRTGTCASGDSVQCDIEEGKTTWFRCISQGIAGAAKAYTYENQMKTDPLSPTGVTASMMGTNVTVKWKGHDTAENPTDTYEVWYAIDIPGVNLACPAAATWVRGASGINNKAKTATFSIAQRPGTDKCLWVKVISVYGEETAESDVVFAQGGKMAPPTMNSCQVDQANKSVTITFTDNSAVPDSKIAIIYSDGSVLGSFAHGSTEGSATFKGSDNVQFGIYVFQGSSPTKCNLRSDAVYSDGTNKPLAPTSVSCTGTAKDGTVSLSWTNAWTDADGTEISYADHEDAWYSTAEPTRYEINERKTNWNVADLETGKTWYFQLRSIGTDSSGNVAYSPYSTMISVDLASAPEKPELFASDNVIEADENLTLTWVYTTTDKTDQASAVIYDQPTGDTENFTGDGTTTEFALRNAPTSITKVTIDGEEEESTGYSLSGEVVTFISAPADGAVIVIQYAFTGTKTVINTVENNSQTYSFTPGWNYGSTHNLSVVCTSKSGYMSAESDSLQILVAPEPVVNSLEGAIISGFTDGVLTALPMVLNITGAGTGGKTAIEIKRKGDYRMERPDGSEMDGFDGETIFTTSYDGEKEIEIGQKDLVGSLDDGAEYRLIAIVTDEVGQQAQKDFDFKVAWAHQASIPTATAAISDLTALITPAAPSTFLSGDVVDIYRLSIDKPELIVEGGSFGKTYRDPYPAYKGGYRCVHRTYNGDYITADDRAAWCDVYTNLIFKGLIIAFGNEQVQLPYNVSLDNQWTKEFTETKYLNGHIQGDWNAGTSRSTTITTDISSDDQETIEIMRELAVYEGICHVRTSDGSSFAADVQVSESRESTSHHTSFSLTITRVEAEGFDGEEVASA